MVKKIKLYACLCLFDFLKDRMIFLKHVLFLRSCIYFCLPVLLKYNWHTVLYKFKIYSIIIWLTISWNIYHNMFSKYPSFIQIQNSRNRKNIFTCENSWFTLNNFHIQLIAVLIIFIIFYITSLVLTYNWELLPFDYLHPVPKPLLLVVINLISFSMTLFLKYNWRTALCQLLLQYMVPSIFLCISKWSSC